MHEGKLLKDKLKSGHICLGIFNASSDPCIPELLSGSGDDFIIIDAEHGALGIETVQANIMATMGSNTVPLVRVPINDEAYIKRLLPVFTRRKVFAGSDRVDLPTTSVIVPKLPNRLTSIL